MAAIENKELTHSLNANAAPRVAATGVPKKAPLSLVKHVAVVDAKTTAVRALPPTPVETPAVVVEDSGASGLAGLWRLAQVARVLGTMSLYLFLNDYDIRAAFNQRIAERKLAEARALGRSAYFKARARDLFLRRALDRLIRFVRFVVYRGAEGTDAKERQLERQGVWLKEHLIKLGPTFIKIGQSLGTRADLLPLAYIKELALLQDQVPPFPNELAFARIESELGRGVSEAYAEFDTEPVASASLGQV